MLSAFLSARASDNRGALHGFYVGALGCTLLGEFTDRDGLDGLVVGEPQGGAWRIAFFRERSRPDMAAAAAASAAAAGQHVVFHLPGHAELSAVAAALDAAGHPRTSPPAVYRSRRGVTFVDPDGYPVVLAVPHDA